MNEHELDEVVAVVLDTARCADLERLKAAAAGGVDDVYLSVVTTLGFDPLGRQ